MTDIKTLELISIRDQKLDEYWLQDYICQDPACLGLGDLEVISKEKKQSSGGRLDILMKGSDDELYEIEVMLGETDETHIIRTIEYWDIEKKKRPKRQHTAVLIAERINTRFYNVINLLSHSVPIIGIQANLYRTGDDVAMVFTKIVDSFEEPELEEENGGYGLESIQEKFPDTAKVIELITPLVVESYHDTRVNYLKNGATIFIDGARRIAIRRRGRNQSSIHYKVSEEDRTFVEELLDSKSISYDFKNAHIRIWLTPTDVKRNLDAHKAIIEKLST